MKILAFCLALLLAGCAGQGRSSYQIGFQFQYRWFDTPEPKSPGYEKADHSLNP